MSPTIVILAAGLGTRMRSRRAKVLHPLAGRPMISYVVRTALAAKPSEVIVIIGYQADEVRAAVEREVQRWERAQATRPEERPQIEFVLQPEPQGTGHALMVARDALARGEGPLVVLSGDMPLVRAETVTELVEYHQKARQVATIVTMHLPDPSGYGRILRTPDGDFVRIVEDRDASEEERAIQEVNSGLYCFDRKPLIGSLDRLTPDNRQGEYYLTDVPLILTSLGYRVGTWECHAADQLVGINSRRDLAEVEARLRKEIAHRWLESGVTLHDPATIYIDDTVEIGQDTVIYPHVILEGETVIGQECTIHSWTRISNSRVGDRVTIHNSSVVIESRIGDDASIGPFAHLRGEAEIANQVVIGNFVEVKKSVVGRGSKARHLAYLGDATIGERVNIGAGTITCNFDGKRKHRTIIEDDVHIGSDTMLVAPVRVGRGAVTGAGAVVIRDVPEKTLVVGVPAVEKKKVEP
ncbi:MAG TPA: bifunctional UDP-N-acetylglucosamine diphosphorylase/glucosamine-1-phosphate N-acetyltransferase GlmU [Blastocatellia bacterium]|nr:bifunctional UDP-N-acetylglucosamine diphosphorylase/glucosamine-1-phosphate N-acetyltransferase GlmU [Blastocatellia bacterium]